MPSASRTARALAFQHANEIARPYHYSVQFENGMRTEIAPTDHAAIFRFTFTGSTGNVIFDNVNSSGGLTLDPLNGVATGYSDVRSGLSTGATRMFVYAVVDKPVTASGPLTGGGGTGVTGYLQFDTSSTKVVTMRIATSLISVDQAKHNLELEIGASDTFDTVRDRARASWDKTLGVVEVQGATEDQLTTLYSNLYRLNLFPNSAFENTATNDAPVYKHAVQSSTSSTNLGTPTQTAATIADGKVYVNNGFWDTYRTTWAAYSLLEPRQAGEMIDGFVQQYKDGGWIARWSSPGYADLMVGTSSDVAFADAYVKGVTNFDVKAAYDAALKNAAVAPPNANVGRKGLATSIFNGYTSTSTGEGFSWSMDGYINDFGIASMSKALYEASEADDPRRDEYRENYEYYRNRALNYVNLFDPSIKFFQGRTSSGAFRLSPSSFDPRVWGSDYTETNAWNMAFSVPQDGQGLANLYGGKPRLAAKLDQFFATPETAKFPGSYGGTIHEMTEARDVQLGQYGHSNQPSHHIMYMYDYAGQPAQAQAKVREALSRLYIGSEIGQGYPGDEDNGEMSAWYVFSALGFYPLQMGSPYYAIGSPLFTKATIHLENGKDLVVNAPSNSTRNVYVQGLRVNGAPWSKSYLPHDLLANGAVLDFDMGSQPSSWGTGAEDAPLSLTTSDDVPQPLVDASGPGKGTVTASGSTDVTGLFDNTSATRVTLLGPPVNLAGVQTPWIQYQFAGPKEKVTFYTLTSGADTTSGDPASWILKGSNDGQSWTVLDQRSAETFSWRLYTRAFKVARPGRYGYYRIEVTGNGAQLSTTLAEVELLAVPVDVKPPVTTATLTPAAVNGWYVDPTVTLAAGDGTGDGVDSIEYRLDGAQAWATYAGPFPVTGDGTHVLEYRSTDLAGNVEVAKTLTFKVDGSAPVTTASLSPSPVNGWYADPTITLAATDEASSVDRSEYRLDGATSWTVYERPFKVTGDGEHTLEYRSADLAGNVEATRSLSFMIDTVPPGTTASLSPDPVNGWYVNPTVTLTATAGRSGVDRTEYRLDRAQEWKTYTGSFHVTGDGAHTLEYRSVNTAGVVEEAKTLIFKVDGNGPATDARLSPNAVSGWYVNPTVTLSGTDEASGVDRSEYRLDGAQTWTAYGGPFPVTGDGGHTLEYRSVDLAGNVEATKTLTFKVDATKPAITLTKPTDGAIYLLNAAVNAAYSCNDSRSGVDTCRGSVANGAALDTSSVGFHDFTVRASDVAGNTRTLTVTYQVVWAFDGFFSPVKNPPTLNAVKAGSSVPIKFTLGGNYGLAIFAEGYPKSVVISCASGAPQDDIGDTVVAQNGLSYSGGKYTYGWKTSTAWAGTCRQFAVVLIDGTLHRASFKLKK
jgi:predicted alpha-1,2-mannosidase